MCEIVSVLSNPNSAKDSLLSTYETLKHVRGTTQNSDGIGFCAFAEGQRVFSDKASKINDLDTEKLLRANERHPNVVVGHVRDATVGENNDNNAQPFSEKINDQIWSIVHNGTVRYPGLESEKKFGDFEVKGSTDSEKLALLIAKSLQEKASKLSDEKIPTDKNIHEFEASVRDTLKGLYDKNNGEIPGKANIVLTNGTYTFAFTNGDGGSLYSAKSKPNEFGESSTLILTAPTKEACTKLNIDESTIKQLERGRVHVYKENSLIHKGQKFLDNKQIIPFNPLFDTNYEDPKERELTDKERWFRTGWQKFTFNMTDKFIAALQKLSLLDINKDEFIRIKSMLNSYENNNKDSFIGDKSEQLKLLKTIIKLREDNSLDSSNRNLAIQKLKEKHDSIALETGYQGRLAPYHAIFVLSKFEKDHTEISEKDKASLHKIIVDALDKPDISIKMTSKEAIEGNTYREDFVFNVQGATAHAGIRPHHGVNSLSIAANAMQDAPTSDTKNGLKRNYSFEEPSGRDSKAGITIKGEIRGTNKEIKEGKRVFDEISGATPEINSPPLKREKKEKLGSTMEML